MHSQQGISSLLPYWAMLPFPLNTTLCCNVPPWIIVIIHPGMCKSTNVKICSVFWTQEGSDYQQFHLISLVLGELLDLTFRELALMGIFSVNKIHFWLSVKACLVFLDHISSSTGIHAHTCLSASSGCSNGSLVVNVNEGYVCSPLLHTISLNGMVIL